MNVKATVWLMAALMCGAAIAGISVAPPTPKCGEDFLAAAIPETFGEWKKIEDSPQVVDPATAETLKRIYKEVLSRTYINGAGYRVMLSTARSCHQIGIQAAHRPEVCYPAQGFERLGEVQNGELATAHGPIEVTRMTMRKGGRTEPITYWLTMADRVVRTQWDKRIVQFIALMTGQSPGGLLFRVSSIDQNSDSAFAMQQKFVADMMNSVSSEPRRKLSGLISPTVLTRAH